MSLISKARQEVTRSYARHGAFSRSLDRLNRMPLLRDFVRRFPDVPRFPTRETMWDHLAAPYLGSPLVYLEFGVHQGHSILHWLRANDPRDSVFVGFDTFTGLPETWNQFYPKGHFDTGGRAPESGDPRVSFVAGLFQDTLDGFLGDFDPGGRPLVVHIDCDLYSSALYCLTRLDPWLTRGTLVIFDEFGDVQNEFRAFDDWRAGYRRDARLVCTHDSDFTAAVEIL